MPNNFLAKNSYKTNRKYWSIFDIFQNEYAHIECFKYVVATISSFNIYFLES